MKNSVAYFKWISIIVSSILYYHIGYVIVRNQFQILLIDFSALFVLYFFAIKYLAFDWFTSIFIRLVLITSIPTLSDDYFRFIWDGDLLINGLNPFKYLPTELPKNEIYDGLNSKNYYSVYPPLLQLIFGFASFIANGNLLVNIIALRTIIILADAGSIYLIIKLLIHFNFPKKNVQLFALNPLVVLELTGNLHFEGVTFFFVLIAFYILFCFQETSKNISYSAFSLSLGILVKLVPIIFIPMIINKLGWKKGVVYSIIVMVIVVFAFIPFLSFEMILHISNSLNLYFQKFEFNASIYYVFKRLGILINNNNPIQVLGPMLSIIGGFIMLWISFTKNKLVENNFTKALFIISVYFLMATTVHPWYIITVIGLGSFTNYRFQIIWSAACILSYAAYQSASYTENLWLIALEYIVVFSVIIFEINRNLKFIIQLK